MPDLQTFIRYELACLLVALVLVITYQMLTGKIRLSGLLSDGETGQFSTTRLQALFVAAIATVPFLFAMMSAQESLPEAPESLLLLLSGGSNAIYLTAKAWPLMPERLKRDGQ